MALREEYEKLGNWLFRWRSYLPLVLTGFFLVAIKTTPASEINSNPLFEFMCLLVSCSGLALRMYAVGCAPRGTSGRNVSEQRAETINQTGIYSLVRHPLYLGNFIIWIGLSLFTGAWWLVLVTAASCWLYYEKMMFAEEEFLRRKFGDKFLIWAEQTPLFFPESLGDWVAPKLPFSLKNAVRREYSGFNAIICVLCLIKLVKDTTAAEQLTVNGFWLAIFLVSFAIYLTLLFLKKKTNFLDVPGR